MNEAVLSVASRFFEEKGQVPPAHTEKSIAGLPDVDRGLEKRKPERRCLSAVIAFADVKLSFWVSVDIG